MKYFKIYAQCCKAVKPITEVAKSELSDLIEPLVSAAGEIGILENAIDYEFAYQTATDQLEKVGIISCGEYCIEKCETVPQERPRVCGFDTYIFED